MNVLDIQVRPVDNGYSSASLIDDDGDVIHTVIEPTPSAALFRIANDIRIFDSEEASGDE